MPIFLMVPPNPVILVALKMGQGNQYVSIHNGTTDLRLFLRIRHSMGSKVSSVPSLIPSAIST